MGYVPSRYNLHVPPSRRRTKHLICNVRAGSLAEFGEHELGVLNDPTAHPGKSELLRGMAEEGFLVPSDLDEAADFIVELEKSRRSRETFDLFVLPTMRCNLACPYCVEDGVRGGRPMDHETLHALERWVEHWLPDGTNQLNVFYYGGEPLLEPEILHHLSDFFVELVEKRDLDLRIQLITNGILADRDTIDPLAEFGLDSMKVTLDGWGPFHDAKRPFADGRGTYDRILRNLESVHDLAKIHVGGNFDAANLDSFDLLLEDLEQRGLLPHLASLRFKPIIGGGRAATCGVSCISDTDLDAYLELKKNLIHRGFGEDDVLAIGPCSAFKENFYVVDPQGEIYRCPAFVGHRRFVVGDVHQTDRAVAGMKPRSLSKCMPCRFLPACGGGCAYAAYLSKGDEGKVACEAKYFVRTAKELVKAQAERLEQ